MNKKAKIKLPTAEMIRCANAVAMVTVRKEQVEQIVRGGAWLDVHRHPVSIGAGRQVAHQRGVQLQMHLHRAQITWVVAM